MVENYKPIEQFMEDTAAKQGFDMTPIDPVEENSPIVPLGAPINNSMGSASIEDDMIMARRPDGTEIQIPKDALFHLSTKAGEVMDITTKDLIDAPWSKRENRKLVNERALAQKALGDTQQRYSDLESLVSASEDLKGVEWTAQALKALYQLNPKRGEDIKAFVDAIQNDGLSQDQLDKSDLKKRTLDAERRLQDQQKSADYGQLYDYSADLGNQLVQQLGVDPQYLMSRVEQLKETGRISYIDNAQSAQQAATTIYNEILVDKAMAVTDILKLSPDEVSQYQSDLLGLLTANPQQHPDDLARKLGSMIGKPHNNGSANKAKEKVDTFRRNTGRRPESITPTPLQRDPSIVNTSNSDPFTYISKKYGYNVS